METVLSQIVVLTDKLPAPVLNAIWTLIILREVLDTLDTPRK